MSEHDRNCSPTQCNNFYPCRCHSQPQQDAERNGLEKAITKVEDYRDWQDEDHATEEAAATEILQRLRALKGENR